MAYMHQARHPDRPPFATTSRLLILGGLLAGFAVRLVRLGDESLWYDETVSVYLARLPLDAMIAHTAGDIHPPGYYILLHLWQLVAQPSLAHGLEFLFAWPSLVFGVLVLPLLFVIGQRLFGQRTAVAAVWLAAFHPFLTWYSQEVRMYSLGAALGLLCLWAILQWQRSNSRDQAGSASAWLAVYCVAAAIGLYTLYYFLFLVAALNLIAILSLWLHEKQPTQITIRHALLWFATQVLVLLLWSPWLPIFWRQSTDPPVPPWRITWDSAAAFWHSLSESLAALLVGQTPPGVLVWPWAVVTALLVVGLALLAALRKSRQTTEDGRRRAQIHAVLVLIYVFAPAAILFAVTLLGTPIYHVRYLALFAPMFVLIPAALLVAAWRRSAWLGAAMWATLLVTSALSLRAFWTNPLYRSDDHRQAVAELAQGWRPGDAILANAGWIYPLLATYWPVEASSENGSTPPPLQSPIRLFDYTKIGVPATLGLPQLYSSGSVDGPPNLGWGNPAADFFAISTAETRASLDALAANARRIWQYRLYDTVSDPTGVIRTWFADNSQPLLDNAIPGRDFGRLQLFGTQPFPQTLPAGAPQATFGGALALLDATAPTTVTAGSYLYSDLLWQALPPLAALPADLSASLRLYDSAGQQVAQADGPLNFLPTRTWTLESAYSQAAALPIPANLSEGVYSLQIVIYRQDNAQPLPVDATQEQTWRISDIAVERAQPLLP